MQHARELVAYLPHSQQRSRENCVSEYNSNEVKYTACINALQGISRASGSSPAAFLPVPNAFQVGLVRWRYSFSGVTSQDAFFFFCSSPPSTLLTSRIPQLFHCVDKGEHQLHAFKFDVRNTGSVLGCCILKLVQLLLDVSDLPRPRDWCCSSVHAAKAVCMTGLWVQKVFPYLSLLQSPDHQLP